MEFTIVDGELIGYAQQDGVTDAVIPEGVTKIKERAFADCEYLVIVDITDDNVFIEERAFCNTPWYKKHKREFVIVDNELWEYVGNRPHVKIPQGVTKIRSGAFYDCTWIESVIIPDSVTSIGFRAFKDCKSLKSITLPDSLTVIGNCAFSVCEGLEAINIPAGVTRIGASAFSGCDRLGEIAIPKSVKYIGDGAFEKRGC